jgi:hypothetical protein
MRLRYIYDNLEENELNFNCTVPPHGLPSSQSYLKTPRASWNLLDYYTIALFLFAEFPTK